LIEKQALALAKKLDKDNPNFKNSPSDRVRQRIADLASGGGVFAPARVAAYGEDIEVHPDGDVQCGGRHPGAQALQHRVATEHGLPRLATAATAGGSGRAGARPHRAAVRREMLSVNRTTRRSTVILPAIGTPEPSPEVASQRKGGMPQNAFSPQLLQLSF